MAMFNPITCNSFPMGIASPRAVLFTFYIGRILAQSAAYGGLPQYGGLLLQNFYMVLSLYVCSLIQ